MTTPALDTAAEESPPPSLYRAVSGAAYRLSKALLNPLDKDHARSRATLSRLRRGVALEPSEDPITWGLVIDEILADMPADDVRDRQDVSWSEWAAYSALSLFAVHQQSLGAPMHVSKVDLGHAVGQLSRETGIGSIKARLDSLLVATTPTAIRYHLRSLVGLLNAHQIPLDYGRLAEDLRRLRSQRTAGRVRVSWSRGYAQGSRPPHRERDVDGMASVES